MLHHLKIWLCAFFCGMALSGAVVAEDRTSADAPHTFAGKTFRFDDGKLRQVFNDLPGKVRFATYIVYFSADGQAHVWLPTQRIIFERPWAGRPYYVEGVAQDTLQSICIKAWPGKSRRRGICRHQDELAVSVQEVRDGDVLNLQSGTLPCRICTRDMTIDRVKRNSGG